MPNKCQNVIEPYFTMKIFLMAVICQMLFCMYPYLQLAYMQRQTLGADLRQYNR